MDSAATQEVESARLIDKLAERVRGRRGEKHPGFWPRSLGGQYCLQENTGKAYLHRGR